MENDPEEVRASLTLNVTKPTKPSLVSRVSDTAVSWVPAGTATAKRSCPSDGVDTESDTVFSPTANVRLLPSLMPGKSGGSDTEI